MMATAVNSWIVTRRGAGARLSVCLSVTRPMTVVGAAGPVVWSQSTCQTATNSARREATARVYVKRLQRVQNMLVHGKCFLKESASLRGQRCRLTKQAIVLRRVRSVQCAIKKPRDAYFF